MTIIRQRDGLAFTFDNALAEFYEPTILVTNHPVEDGVDVTDHAQQQPLIISIRVLQTETPLGAGVGPDGPDRLLAATEFLRGIERELVDVVTTKFGTFTNMLLTAYPHEVGILRHLPITLRFQQTRIATAQAVIIPPEAPVEAEQVGFPDEQDTGAQGTDDSSDEPEKEARDVSVARKLLESVGVL